MKKLSPTQEIVLHFMGLGWELGRVQMMHGVRCWLQKDGIGKGGQTKDVKCNTVDVLIRKDYIIPNGVTPQRTQLYGLKTHD